MMADLALGSLLPLADAGGSFWFPPEASSVAAGSDFTYDFILWLSILFFVAICGVTGYFVFKYRKRPGHTEEITSTHNTRLELAWSIIPLFLLMAIFGISTYWYLIMVTPPTEDVTEIEVTAKQWNWTFSYQGNGLPAGKKFMVPAALHVVKDRNYQLIMTTPDRDVLHSLFIPAFRVKQDCVPGRYNKLWFRPTMSHMESGNEDGFMLYCTEYCGRDHSVMTARVFVWETEAEWRTAIVKGGDITQIKDLVTRGESIYNQNCASCHSLDGTVPPGGGPSWQGLWGKEETMTDGSKVVVDETYVRDSTKEPGKQVVQGYPDVMTPFDWGDQNDAYIEGIIAYMKSLKE
ncbi:MAG: c-type cytochrome [Planctomycetes bacterium]|nr:c-type cytochrome [Planctomycetota bacterium]